MEIDEKILSLIKFINPDDPVDYILNNPRFKKYSLNKINDCIKSCDKCDICKNNIKSLVFGNIDAPILVISENITEDQYNNKSKYTTPLQGEAKKFLKKALEIFNGKEDLMCFINLVNCYPTKKIKNELLWRAPTQEERNNCLAYTDRLIGLINPEIIITMGSVPYNALHRIAFDDDKIVKIEQDRGEKFCYRNHLVIPTFHPQLLLNKNKSYSDKNIEEYKEDFISNLIEAFYIVKENRPDLDLSDLDFEME